MKKQFAVITSFCALLTLSALAPKVFWQDSHNNISRFPASEKETVADDKKSEVPDIQVVEVKVEKPKDIIIEVVEVKVAEEVAQVTCLEDKQPTALEEEIKKLMTDKKIILKEIEDLKATKLASQKTKKVEETSETEDHSELISKMTSMMSSQQEQQQMIMQQMFTMMNQMMQMQMASNSNQNFMGSMNFETPQYGMSNFYPNSSFNGRSEPGIGIGYPAESVFSYKNPYTNMSRSPSAQNEFGYIQRDLNVQPQLQSQYPSANTNFSFSTSDYSSEMQRMQF